MIFSPAWNCAILARVSEFADYEQYGALGLALRQHFPRRPDDTDDLGHEVTVS